MKRISILTIFFSLALLGIVKAQQPASAFTGAVATLNSHNALYVLNSGEEKKISSTLRNINNALNDPRLKGKLQVELVVFGDAFIVYQKTGPYEARLKELVQKGVILAQCENTLKQRKIEKNSLFPFVSYVPTANGEIIIRHYQGWAIIHP